MKNVTAMVLAGGSGLRMGEGPRKQYRMLCGVPVLVRSLEVFLGCERIRDVVLVAPAEDIPYLTKTILPQLSSPEKVSKIVSGGPERVYSCRNGFDAITLPCEAVLIHDAARPLLHPEDLQKLLDVLEETGACVAAVPVSDTIREIRTDGTLGSTPDRAGLRAMQTPQCFAWAKLREAFAGFDAAVSAGAADPLPTDDAELVLRYGEGTVTAVTMTHPNFKITRPEDLALAELLIRDRE